MALLDSGYSLTCEDESTIGGVRRLFLINREKVLNFTASTADHEYTAVDVDDWTDVTSRFHEFEFLDNTLNATFENSLEDNGTNFITAKISGFIPRQEKAKAEKLQKAIKSCKLIAIVENNQGEAFVYGYDERLKNSAALRAGVNGETGADLKDRNGYEFRLEGRGSDIPREFTGAIVTTVGTTVSF
ncbi:MAG: hypothetical protein SFW35_00915 [Chitinophagales bacterium]|nr:hypothetical protein [Chitinophagales bacterium]